MRKSIRKSDRDNNIEFAYFHCSFGHTSVFKKKGGYTKTNWKNDLYKNGSAKSIPCKAKVVFEKVYSEDWTLKEI